MMNNIVSTFRADIYIGGDIEQAKQVCREFCMKGLCVTVTPTTFIYTGGEEAGVVVGLINYPRFPSTPTDIIDQATELAGLLRDRLCQHSYSIVTPNQTYWSTLRADR